MRCESNMATPIRVLISRAVVLGALVIPQSLLAANIYIQGQGPIRIQGTITKDDPARFRSLLAQLNPLDPVRQNVVMDSDGGDVYAAIDIGRQIRAKALSTDIWDGRCVSACVFAFAGGVVRMPCLYVCDQTPLGIHRPYSTDTSVASGSEADRLYKKMDAAIRTYFKEMNISDLLADDMLRINPQDVKFLTRAEAERYGLAGFDPAYEDLEASKMAKHYGISKQEYFVRKARSERECKLDVDLKVTLKCIGEIMSGRN